MQITLKQLSEIAPLSTSRANNFLAPLNATLEEFEINTVQRVACFLAQLLHESGQFRYVEELASGDAYEFRQDLGNTAQGDGKRFKGRGLIQITGKTNYLALSLALDIDCFNKPELLEEPLNACRSAGWFWKVNNLSKWADVGDIDGVSDIVNRGHKTVKIGDSNGYAERLWFYNKAVSVLSKDTH